MQRKFKTKAEAAGPGGAWCFIAVPLNMSALWDKLAHTHRKEFAQWIGGAKQEDTRQRRAAKAVDMMLAKKTMSGSR